MSEDAGALKVWREAVSAGENCLSLEALEKILEGASDPKPAQHVASCPHCQAELAMLRSFESSVSSKDEQPVLDSIADQLQRSRYSTVHIPFWRSLFTVPRLAGFAALALIGLGISLYVSNRQDRPVLSVQPSENQNMRSGEIRLTDPSGDLERPPEDFHWEALPLAKSYSVQLIEVDGTILWKGAATGNVLIANRELKEKMKPGKTLLWKVTALDARGRPMASSAEGRFRITLKKQH